MLRYTPKYTTGTFAALSVAVFRMSEDLLAAMRMDFKKVAHS